MSSLGNMDFASGYGQLSPALRSQVESEVKQTLDRGRQRAYEVLASHRQELDNLAKALIEYETLSLAEVEKILKGEKLPKLTSSKSSSIKIPEIVLPPGLGGTSTDNASGGHQGALPPTGK